MNAKEYNGYWLITGPDIEAVTILANDIKKAIDTMRSPRVEYVRKMQNGEYMAKVKYYGLD